MTAALVAKVKPYRGVNMEGPIATWYAKNTASSLPEFRALAARIAGELDRNDWVLEVAPGPGYLAVELARLGLHVSAVDISRNFVRLTGRNAALAGVAVDARQGDAAHLPFDDEAFDFVVCRAAFKNFSDPVGALREMRRVLRPGGTALVIDMRREASDSDIAHLVDTMRLGAVDGWFTRAALRSLRHRAYTEVDFTRMIGEAGFSNWRIDAEDVGFEIRMTR
jgi:ubiquinone/menaquinone biosynthesis C-methylase UbiE